MADERRGLSYPIAIQIISPFTAVLIESHHQLQIIHRVRKLTVPVKTPTVQQIQYQKTKILADISI